MAASWRKKSLIISLELLIALTFIIGADWAGESLHQFFQRYYADLALPFGYYFLLMLIEDDFLLFRPRCNKALAVFLLMSTSEILQYFGIYALATVFDPLDFVMYALGVSLAALFDVLVTRIRERQNIRPPKS